MQTFQDDIQRSLANESTTILLIAVYNNPPPPLTDIDAQRIIDCLIQENHRFSTLEIRNYDIHNDAVLNVFRNGLPLCTSITKVTLNHLKLTNEDLECLLPAFCNTSVTSLHLYTNNIQGQRGGEVLRDLLVGNNTLRELNLSFNRHLGPEGAIGFGQGLADNHALQKLILMGCNIGTEGLANLLLSMGMVNNMTLTYVDLSSNRIEGADSGSKVSLLLQRLPALKTLSLYDNPLGPLGARALAPGLAAAIHLESLDLSHCKLGNDGVASLIPDGQVNRTLTNLNLDGNDIQGTMGIEIAIALASRCTNLDRIDLFGITLNPRLDMLLERKRLCTAASALAGSPFPVLFRFVKKAHGHEQGLSAIFVILQNDGDDYFCTALNRAN